MPRKDTAILVFSTALSEDSLTALNKTFPEE